MAPRLAMIPFLLVVSLSLIGAALGRPLYTLPSKVIQKAKKPLQMFRPFNLAHRGANGEMPEETAEAYLRAIEEGADFIETDILATKDGQLICFHDVILDDTTDVANHKEFADRNRSEVIQDKSFTGFFVVDFTLDELKSLRAKQRYPYRDPQYNGKFSIITFEEFISIALDGKRTVGIYPEIKNPVHVNKHVKWTDGKKVEDRFVEILKKYGYKGTYKSEDWKKQPLFIQSFNPSSLVYVSKLTDSPKILLIDDITTRTEDTKQTYEELTSDSYLEYIKDYVVGIGPWKDSVVRPKEHTNDTSEQLEKNHLNPPTDLVAKAHALNLQVHPYTYRNEDRHLHFDFHQDPYAEYDYWINVIGVDGLFTDFTGSLHRYQELVTPSPKS